MPRDGNGNYGLPAGQPVVTSTPISSTVFNAFTADITTAMTASIAKDGQTTPTTDLPMGGNKHTGVADGSARAHYATVGQLQDMGVLLAGAVSGTDTLTANLTPAITGYVNYRPVLFLPSGNNTGTSVTLSLNGLTAKSILKAAGVALDIGDLVTNVPAVVVYNGTAWYLQNPQKIANTRITGLGTLATQSGTFSGTSSGTNTGDQTITLTGDVTGSGTGSFATTLSAAAILAKLVTVDGAGSTLDADFLDGISSAGFAAAVHTHAAADVTSGTFADARIASSNVTQFQSSFKGRNITGKSGTSFTIQSGGTASGGSDGDVIGIY